MSKLKVIVEGEADKKFLIDFIKHCFEHTLTDEDFIMAEGNLLEKPARANSIQKNTIQGGINIIILDANGDIEETRQRVANEIVTHQLQIDNQFYFPNNTDTGNLETLLRNIVNSERENIFNCIDNYADCLEMQRIPQLRAFDEKARIFVFIDSFTVGGPGKESERSYREALLWNLDSEYLEPLRGFLSPYFIKDQ